MFQAFYNCLMDENYSIQETFTVAIIGFRGVLVILASSRQI